MNRYLVILCVSLTACGKMQSQLLGSNTMIPLSKPAPAKPQTLLVMGQSNAYFFVTQTGMNELKKDEGSQSINAINCAVIGSPMDRWTPTGDLYQACMIQVSTATPTAIFFWQGENDADISMSPYWLPKFESMVNSLRAKWPGIPIYYARIHIAWTTDPGAAILYQAQTNIPGVTMVDIDNLTCLLPASPHYSNPDYATVGDLLYNLMK